MSATDTADSPAGDDDCVDCNRRLPARSPTSPAERRCETCWWTHQTARWLAGDTVHPLAETPLTERHPRPPTTT